MQSALAVSSVAVQMLALCYSSHRWLVLWRSRRDRRAPGAAPASFAAPVALREERTLWPSVTVQLPIYNERRVVQRLIAAAAALDYPGDRLEIQVLDDSTDETASADCIHRGAKPQATSNDEKGVTRTPS